MLFIFHICIHSIPGSFSPSFCNGPVPPTVLHQQCCPTHTPWNHSCWGALEVGSWNLSFHVILNWNSHTFNQNKANLIPKLLYLHSEVTCHNQTWSKAFNLFHRVYGQRNVFNSPVRTTVFDNPVHLCHYPDAEQVISIRLTHLITGDQITEMENKREIKGPLMPLTSPFRDGEVTRWEYIRWFRQMIQISTCTGRGYTPKISDNLNGVAAGGKRVFHRNLAARE